MLSMHYIREHPDDVRQMLARRHVEAPLDEILTLDVEHRRLLSEVEELRARRNADSKRIGQTKDPGERQRLIAEQQGVRDRIDALDARRKEVEERLRSLLLQVPNMIVADVPDGPDESGNVVVRQEGALREFDFAPAPHCELGEKLRIIDF